VGRLPEPARFAAEGGEEGVGGVSAGRTEAPLRALWCPSGRAGRAERVSGASTDSGPPEIGLRASESWFSARRRGRSLAPSAPPGSRAGLVHGPL
jgi:hypothetical protein